MEDCASLMFRCTGVVMAIFLLALFPPKINEANFLNPGEDNSLYVFAAIEMVAMVAGGYRRISKSASLLTTWYGCVSVFAMVK